MTTISLWTTSEHGVEKRVRDDWEPWPKAPTIPVSVIIPTIPTRIHALNRALKAIEGQTIRPAQVIIQLDRIGEGAPTVRNRALQKVPAGIEAVAFGDDDDYFMRHHLARCWAALLDQRADYVYPWFMIAGPSIDPFPQFFRRPWDDRYPHQTTIVTMVRRELAQAVGFREVEDKTKVTPEGHIFGEDFQFTLECLEAGAKIYHVPDRTWFWVVTGHNTSGRPTWKQALEPEPRSGDSDSAGPGPGSP